MQAILLGQGKAFPALLDRAVHDQLPGAELQIGGAAIGLTIESVTDDGKADACEVPADLMFAAGLDQHIE